MRRSPAGKAMSRKLRRVDKAPFLEGQRVRYSSGGRDVVGFDGAVRRFEPSGEATLESGEVMFGGHTLCCFIRKDDGGHDYIAVTHLEHVAAGAVDEGAPPATV